ncbi:MAG: carbon storage regulator CsrA [Oscillospiraceae bacterium]
MLVLQRKLGETLIINDNIEISIVEMGKDKVKIGIEAPKDIKVLRKEILEIKEQNKEASRNINQELIKNFIEKIKYGNK